MNLPMPMHAQGERGTNFYDNSFLIELDWETNDENLTASVQELHTLLRVKGHYRNLVKHIRGLLIVCARLEKYAPDAYIAYSRNNNFDQFKSLRNPKNLKVRKICEIIDALADMGWLESKKGIHYWDYKRLSRFKAAPPLKDFIQSYGLNESVYYKMLLNDGVILKNRNGNIISEYRETTETQWMKWLLESYNDLILKSEIKLERQISRERYFFDNALTYRIFNNGSFEQGGRFYGGWWTQCRKEDRRYITIDGQPTVELDYKANHLCMIYGLENKPMPEDMRPDPYRISDRYPRELIKAVFTKAINAETETQAWGAFNREIHTSQGLRRWKHLSLLSCYKEIVGQLLHHHPVIKPYIHSGCGLKLMYHDSQVADWVLNMMTNHGGEGIPCLCIHDSFLVGVEYEALLKGYMQEAYTARQMPHGMPEIKTTRSALVN